MSSSIRALPEIERKDEYDWQARDRDRERYGLLSPGR